jgi:type IV pilus assembly protein PilO
MNVLEELRSLDINEPGRWPLPFRIAAVVIVLTGISALGIWHFVVKDEIPELEQLVQDEQDRQDLFEELQGRAVNLDAYKEQLATIERDFGTMLQKLPGRTEVPNLLEDISRTALGVGLTQKHFDPQNVVNRDFYAELPIQLRYEGTYHEIGLYISDVAALSRIVTLHDIRISRLSPMNEPERLQFDATAKTYRYLDEESP